MIGCTRTAYVLYLILWLSQTKEVTLLPNWSCTNRVQRDRSDLGDLHVHATIGVTNVCSIPIEFNAYTRDVLRQHKCINKIACVQCHARDNMTKLPPRVVTDDAHPLRIKDWYPATRGKISLARSISDLPSPSILCDRFEQCSAALVYF
jgi:hypothetical protein